MAKRKMAIPKSLGGCADKLYSLRAERYGLQNQVKAIKEHESAIEAHVIAELPKDKADGITGRSARAEIKKKSVPRVSDWPKFYKHVLKTKDFSLMQKRLADGAVKERWECDEVVPGVEAFNAISVSITKK